MSLEFTQVLNILSDPVKLIEIVGGIFAIIGGLYAAGAIVLPWWRAWRDRRSLRKRLGAELYTPEDIIRATTYYIRPKCQSIDPAGSEEFRYVYTTKEDLFEAVDNFLASPWEYKHAILLADSGMGKTSFVLNYYAYHWRHRRKRKRFDLAVIPLGIPNADDHIRKVANPKDTVLLLDAFDEDIRAMQNYRERLKQLLDLSKDFRQVLITCRTQFFQREEEIPRETGIIRIGVTSAGQSREYVFYKLYISPFSDAQVEAYLKRRFSIWRLRQRHRARVMAQKIPDLVVRPMLLAVIPELVQSGKSVQYAFELYEEMVEGWLERERPFVKDKEALRLFSELLAVNLYVNRQRRGAERIPRSELADLAKEWSIPLDEWQLSSRSLLNRDAMGNYKFAHSSIMEYLFVKRFADGDEACRGLEWTDTMKAFLLEMIQHRIATKQSITFDISTADLSGYRLSLRATPQIFENEEVIAMLKKRGYFEKSLHGEGKGIVHLYQLQERQGVKLVLDYAVDLIWQQGGSENVMTFRDAEAYIRQLNAEKYGGYDDWRLPTLEEAMSLMESEKRNGDLFIAPEFDQTQKWIWTADKKSAALAWVVIYYYGMCGDVLAETDLFYVRAVRREQPKI
ncbi:MAG: DUF1566 domain-containing protein [candidate division KSB1 bacterium]|nr:DUF1566 domain-containing protein [candidate division KSB1 bacterium]MDZ7302111.1 DUF1566 domain-containing protein [candidate division KSB1 bacterium]MDZ7311152.1 DUF1566 domain-containing protein [candidate division KSB1 bacterium]